MKVAHLVAQFYPYVGGAEICVHNVCRSLVRKNHVPVVITTTPQPETKVDFGYQVEYLWNRTCGLLRRFPFAGKSYLNSRLKQLQQKYDFDLWQVTGGVPLGIYAVDFFNEQNIPCILRCCGEDIQKFPQINYGYRLDGVVDAKVRKTYCRYDGLVALTETVKSEYNSLRIPDEKVRIIPNGVDCSKFKSTKDDHVRIEDMRRKFCPEDEKLILTTGRYHPKKGFDLIPDIARSLKSAGCGFKWVIAGSGCNALNERHSDLSALGIVTTENFTTSDADVFDLPPKQLVELYAAADIYVLPTLIETFGMVLVEAMAAGLPIVTTDAPGVCDVIDGDVTGVKTPVGNVELMADKIIELFKDVKLSDHLSSNAWKQAMSSYDWDFVTNQYVAFYEAVAHSSKIL